MKKLFLFISILPISCIITSTSHSASYWANEYRVSSSGSWDLAPSIQHTFDGGYILAGTTYDHDAWILKLNSDGSVDWQKTYGGTGSDFAYFIQKTFDGGYIVAGTTSSFGADAHLWIQKFDTSGNITWQRAYDIIVFKEFIHQTVDGGYIVAGSTQDFYETSKNDFLLMKLDSSGNISWQKIYVGNGFDYFASMEQTSDGGYIMTGTTHSFGDGLADAWILKLNSDGSINWQKTYGGSFSDNAYAIQQTSDGGYIVAGSTYFGGGFSDFSDVWVFKLDSSGNVSWQKAYGGSGQDHASSIQQSSDGGYIVAGSTGSSGQFSWILKLGSGGEITWQKSYGSNCRTFSSIQQAQDGGYIVACPSETDNIYFLKLDNNGEIPDCDIIETSNAIISDTSVLVQDSSAVIYSISGMIHDTTVSPQDTSAEVSTICCYDSDDYDEDLLGDVCDNCPYDANPNQEDVDEDGAGDVCDECTDTDRDGYGNPGFSSNICPLDNCPDDTNSNQEDVDDDGVGDVCDNCVDDSNSDQSDMDEDGLGDVCDNCPDVENPGQEDEGDGDGVGDVCDNCPDDANPNQEDVDEDGAGDVCDNCVDDSNSDQSDMDEDGAGDVCDECTDTDGDGYGNPGFPYNTCTLDHCPEDPENDIDEDGICGDVDNCADVANVIQDDNDGDGVGDVCDNCIDMPNPDQVDNDGDNIGDACDDDDDSDGTLDTNDNCRTIANPDQADTDSDGIGDACDGSPEVFNPLPISDGYYHYDECCSCCGFRCWDWCCYDSDDIYNGIQVSARSYYDGFDECFDFEKGIMEFDLSSIESLFMSGQIEGLLYLIVKDGDLPSDICLSLYSVQDVNENGMIEEVDIDTEDYIAEVCANLQQEDTIVFDVTAAIEHDLFGSNQTNFSGFVLKRSTNWEDGIEFYDHTNLEYGPRLIVIDTRKCEGNFDCDEDCDGTDAAKFKVDFGRSSFGDPCSNEEQCHGDFNCDEDVDGTDAALFKEDFGRSGFSNPCPLCEVGDWCNYQ